MHHRRTHLNVEEARRRFRYDADTGRLTWANGRNEGREAGWVFNGYRLVRLKGQTWRAHVVIMAMLQGSVHPGQIDHINRDGTDNRLANIRCVSAQENALNRSSTKKLPGAYRGARTKRWHSCIRRGGRQVYLGMFPTAEAAAEAYARASAEM